MDGGVYWTCVSCGISEVDSPCVIINGQPYHPECREFERDIEDDVMLEVAHASD